RGSGSPVAHSSFLYCSAAPRDLPSFPTRRSSDLPADLQPLHRTLGGLQHRLPEPPVPPPGRLQRSGGRGHRPPRLQLRARAAHRSEEHTSELQSRENLVCRLLLEKKKTPAGSGEH